MKSRLGFVSNSSSSSFSIRLSDITDEQLFYIINHRVEGEAMGLDYSDNEWEISFDDEYVKGYTSMNNFSMREFLDKIGVPAEVIGWGRGDDPYYDEDEDEEEEEE